LHVKIKPKRRIVYVKKIRIKGARRYVQGFPSWQSKVEKYPIWFEFEDVVIPLSKYEEDESLKKALGNFKSEVIDE